MRAPPDAEQMIAVRRRASARSNTRVIFSPTTEPIEPPMNSKTKTPISTGCPSIRPDAQRMASDCPPPRRAAAQSLGVALRVLEAERVDALDGRVLVLDAVRVQQELQPRDSGHREVMLAMRAHLSGLLQVGGQQRCTAAGALGEHPDRNAAFLSAELVFVVVSSIPGHGSVTVWIGKRRGEYHPRLFAVTPTVFVMLRACILAYGIQLGTRESPRPREAACFRHARRG